MKISKSYQNLSVKGLLEIGDAYTLPSIDGTSGYVLMTDGIGGVTWQSPAMFSINSDDVVEGITNLYFTGERVDDRVSSLIQNGTGISWAYNDSLNTLTGTVSLAPFTADNLAEGVTNKYYTAEKVDDRVASLIQNGTGLTWTYADGPGTLTGNISLSTFTTTNLSEGTNLYFTNERVDDRVAVLIKNGTGISWIYNDGIGTLTPTINLTPFNTDNLSEGATNKYFADELVDDRVANLVQDSSTVTWTYSDVLNTLTADATAAIAVQEGGILKSTRPSLNFVAGANAVITVADDGFNNRSNITIGVTTASIGTMRSVFSNAVQVGDSDIESLNFSSKFSVIEIVDTYVNIDILMTLSDLTNVSLVSPIENNDVLSYNSNLDIWENKQLFIPTTINELLDVTTVSPIMDSDVLIYDSLSGMWINIDNISFVESAGATMNTDLTLVGNGYFLDEDNMISDDATKVASQQSIKAYVDVSILNAVTGLLDYKGGYNAATNTPDLDTSPSGIKKGDMYTVTADGQFFTQNIEIGDAIIAEIDNPTVLADWTILETNNTYSLQRVLEINNITGGNNINVTNGDSIINDAGDVAIEFSSNAIRVLTNSDDGFSVTPGQMDMRINGIAKFTLDNTGRIIVADNTYLHYEDPNSIYNASFQHSVTLTGHRIYNFPDQSGTLALTSDYTLQAVLDNGSSYVNTSENAVDFNISDGFGNSSLFALAGTDEIELSLSSTTNSRQAQFFLSQYGATMLATSIGGTQSVVLSYDATGGILITDSVNSKGAEYPLDYSANYTARSLVDKGYVDSLNNLQAVFDGGSTYSGNGDLNIVYDDTFSKSTIFQQAGEIFLYVEEAPYEQVSNAQVNITQGSILFNVRDLTAPINPSKIHEFTVDLDGMKFTDTINNKGVVYNNDYSANFTARSLVDKAYVDALTGVTNLSIGTITTTTVNINSDTGTNATIPAASTFNAGLLIATDKVKLDNTTGTNSGDEVSASETVEGIVERATQVEVDAESDTTRYITPATLAAHPRLPELVFSSLATINATVTEIDKIDTLTDNSTHLIEVKATCKSDDDTKYGTWYVMLNVTKFNGTVNIRNTDTMHHHSSSGLTAGSIAFTVNTGDVDIDVTGIVATNIQWDLQYEIITLSTN